MRWRVVDVVRIKAFLSGGVLAFALFGSAMAGPLEDGHESGPSKAEVNAVLKALRSGTYAAASSYWQPLADQGNADAQFMVGVLYAYGLGVPEDRAKSIPSFQKAAEQGNADAQFVLGMRYRDGEGVPQDYVLSHMWINLAAARAGEVTAGGTERYVMIQCRDGVATKMTPDQIAEAQRMAREWKPK